jgi:glutamate racemase
MTMEKKLLNRIGIFDSGAGGLTVLNTLRMHIRGVDFFYLGDTARLPYGTKSAKTILRYTNQNASFLLSKEIDALIIACNSASAYSIPNLKSSLAIPVFGVIEHGARQAVRLSKNKKIGIIGTRATISSMAYQERIKQLNPDIEIFVQSAPLLVPLVEEGWIEGQITEEIIKEYTHSLLEKGIDTLILGCTHYPMLHETIQKIVGTVQLIDSAEPIKDYFLENFTFDTTLTGKTEIFVTDSLENFKLLGQRFKLADVDNIEHIDLQAGQGPVPYTC